MSSRPSSSLAGTQSHKVSTPSAASRVQSPSPSQKPTSTTTAAASISNTERKDLDNKTPSSNPTPNITTESQESSTTNSSSSPPIFSLSTCSVQDYLKATIYPFLDQALQLLDIVRPDDPVEFLAVHLYKAAQETKQNVKELNRLHELKEQIYAEIKAEQSVIGRV